ncbi:ATP-binding protein [uncultured Microscilla sp.]|uniref:ATP-binding protein n=1 Tax=uncultured Microscilla sp. TaxID=432653 RepID=UPI00260AF1FB|nr:ATP-binding protein [uncultured Microscilla sp.]
MVHYYKVNCVRDNLRLIREFVTVVLRNLSLSEIEVNQLVLAVDEICSNLIIYSHNCNPDYFLEINIEDQADKILFEIIDQDANFFDISEYQEPKISNIIKERRKGGVGLMLVNRIMDTVEVSVEDHQNIWRMTKKIAKK